MADLMRHVHALADVELPSNRLAFRLGDAQVGWVTPEAAGLLRRHGCALAAGAVLLNQPDRLPGLARALADAGAFPWRNEAFDVRAAPDTPVLATIDRGALPWFGIAAEGVHVNGLVGRPDGLHVWVARRAADRRMDPGKLDHLFAGGIAAGSTPAETLVKEGAEEAGLPADIVAGATHTGLVSYTVQRPEGLRRDRLHCYELVLSEDVRPVPTDGEVAEFMLWPAERVVHVLRDTDDFKFNVAVVLIRMLQRHGVIV